MEMRAGERTVLAGVQLCAGDLQRALEGTKCVAVLADTLPRGGELAQQRGRVLRLRVRGDVRIDRFGEPVDVLRRLELLEQLRVRGEQREQ